MFLLAELPELTTGLVLAALLAVVSPLAILAGVFVYVGRARQRQEHTEKVVAELRGEVRTLRDSDLSIVEKIRQEIQGHAVLLGDRITNEIQAEATNRDRSMRLLDSRVQSIERWRERTIGAAEAQARGVPSHMQGDTAPMAVTSPRIHQRSGLYPGAGTDDGET